MNNKFYNLKIVIAVCLGIIVVLIGSNILIDTKINTLKQVKYKTHFKIIEQKIKSLLVSKEDVTLSMALALSNNRSIVNAILSNNIEKLSLKDFTLLLRKNTKFKNVWFQIINNKGYTVYRSWTSKRGDRISNVRLDVQKFLKKPTIIQTISTGKFDMTFKTMVPVYDDNEFLGIFEIITHFNSIYEALLKDNINSVILVDKKYKKQLTKAFTKIFIDDYYVANYSANKDLMNTIKNNKVESYIKDKNYFTIDKEKKKFVVVYNIPDIHGNPMGIIISFTNLSSLDMSDLSNLKNNLILYTVLILLFIIIIGYYIFSKHYINNLDNKVKERTNELKQEKEYINNLLNVNPNIVLITKDAKIKSVNKSFLKFFDYNSIDEFRKHYNCICDLFVTFDKEPFAKDKKVHGDLWSIYLAKNQNKSYVIDISHNDTIYNFLANALYLDNDTEVMVTLTNITEAKKKDRLLAEQSKMASMGEMIGNIAHQWRQPLSVISTVSTGMKFEKEFHKFDIDTLEDKCDLINDNAQYLSDTIDDFRDFIRGDRVKVTFELNKEIEKLLHLIEPSLITHNIQHIFNIENDLQLEGYPNELIQALINIFNNAKDVVSKEEENNRFIFMDAYKNNNMIHIDIKDSGGGIDGDVLPHIFEPYFTTKHKSIGTGIGLNMTYNIIVDGMKGNIKASTNSYEYQGKNYTGALFTIVIPKS